MGLVFKLEKRGKGPNISELVKRLKNVKTVDGVTIRKDKGAADFFEDTGNEKDPILEVRGRLDTEKVYDFLKQQGYSVIDASVGENNLPSKDRYTFLFVSFISFIVGVYLFSGNITGNVTGSTIFNSNNLIGAVLFISGLFGIFTYLKRRSI